MGKQLVNVPVGDAKPGETAPRRNYRAVDQAISIPVHSKATTVYELVQEAVKRNGSRQALGQRDLVDIVEEKRMVTKIIDGKETQVEKIWNYFQLSEYKYTTYTELGSIAESLGHGLVELGVKPGNKEKLHIFASTSSKWMEMFLACTTQSIPIVTSYDTLGEVGLTHAISEAEPSAVFVDNSIIKALINPLKNTKTIRYIIHADKIDPNDKRDNGKLYREAAEAAEAIKADHPEIRILSFEELLTLGRGVKDGKPIPPKPADLACIMYTSGSTGTPKGVVLKHSNIVAGVAGATHIVTRKHINQSDRLLAFLPLAHIFELTFELAAFYWGGCLGYGNPRTLSDVSVRNCLGDIREYRPTIMVGVSAVWETVRKGILSQIKKQPAMTQKIFWAAYNTKAAMAARGIPGTGVIDSLIFRKIKQATGGRLRYVLNGGSAVSLDCQKFITTLVCPMLLGYGLTETVANTTITAPDHFEFGVVGELTGAVTVKLRDVAEAGYFAKNNQGEVLIRGASVMPEYFKNEQETRAAFDEEGWFCTGDIGEWTATGQLKLIDRKKNLIKTANGEYIALEKIESVYRSNVYVANLCCCADETRVKPIAIIVPHEVHVKHLAQELGVAGDDVADLVKNPKVHSAIFKSLLETGKSQKLAGIELICGVVFSDKEWTPQNGFVTSAQKLQRRKILADNKEAVEAEYAKC